MSGFYLIVKINEDVLTESMISAVCINARILKYKVVDFSRYIHRKAHQPCLYIIRKIVKIIVADC